MQCGTLHLQTFYCTAASLASYHETESRGPYVEKNLARLGHELARAARSYTKLTHKEHVYVHDNAMIRVFSSPSQCRIERRTKHPNTRSDDLASTCASLAIAWLARLAEHMLWLIPLQHHSTPLLPVILFWS